MKTVKKLVGLIASVMLLTPPLVSVAEAATVLLTDETGYTGPLTDLSAYANGSYNFTFGPAALPDGITFAAFPWLSNSGNGSVIGQGGYGLLSNGTIGGSATYIGLDAATGYGTLTFSSPVSEFGAFFNYAPGQGSAPTVSAYDIDNNLLGSFDLSLLAAISTPGGFNEFVFRGISSDDANISSFWFGGSYIVLSGTATGDLVSAVPIPPALPLFASGLAGLGWLSRRRRKQAG
jgi:hypothetical protein